MYSGNDNNTTADFIFSTIQTLSKENHLKNFKKDHFDYIIVDETHRIGASSYQKVIEYFQPKFLLGMTATPERTDGYDIFKLFDYNIAYEIRLHNALKENMLSPFHYFGVSDIEINEEKTKAKVEVILFNRENKNMTKYISIFEMIDNKLKTLDEAVHN